MQELLDGPRLCHGINVVVDNYLHKKIINDHFAKDEHIVLGRYVVTRDKDCNSTISASISLESEYVWIE